MCLDGKDEIRESRSSTTQPFWNDLDNWRELNYGCGRGAATDYKRSAKATNPQKEVHLMYLLNDYCKLILQGDSAGLHLHRILCCMKSKWLVIGAGRRLDILHLKIGHARSAPCDA